MENIKKNSQTGNMAGNKFIYLASTDEIERIDLMNFNTKKVIMKEGYGFGQIEADLIDFSSPCQDGKYSHEVVCQLTAMLGKYDSMFDEMTRQRFIVKVVDNNNTVWLFGSLDYPLIFEYRHLGKAKASHEHLYELTFRRESTIPIYTTTL